MTTDSRWTRRAGATLGAAAILLAAAAAAAAAPAAALAGSVPAATSAGSVPAGYAPVADSPAPSATATAGPTNPSPRAGLDAWKAFVTTRIDLRLATLSGLRIAVTGATNLTSGHRSTLSGLISSDVSGLTALRTKTGGETTPAAVKADGRSMVVDYRIYLLVVPKVRFTIASDAETAAIARLRTVHDTLEQIATKLAGQGKDVSTEQAELADMVTKLDAATTALDGQADGLLAVNPSPDPAAMRAAVSPVRTAVRGARDDLKAAIQDAKQARTGLKALS